MRPGSGCASYRCGWIRFWCEAGGGLAGGRRSGGVVAAAAEGAKAQYAEGEQADGGGFGEVLFEADDSAGHSLVIADDIAKVVNAQDCGRRAGRIGRTAGTWVVDRNKHPWVGRILDESVGGV